MEFEDIPLWGKILLWLVFTSAAIGFSAIILSIGYSAIKIVTG